MTGAGSVGYREGRMAKLPASIRRKRKARRMTVLAMARLHGHAWGQIAARWRHQGGRCFNCGEPFDLADGEREPKSVETTEFHPHRNQSLACTGCMRVLSMRENSTGFGRGE